MILSLNTGKIIMYKDHHKITSVFSHHNVTLSPVFFFSKWQQRASIYFHYILFFSQAGNMQRRHANGGVRLVVEGARRSARVPLWDCGADIILTRTAPDTCWWGWRDCKRIREGRTGATLRVKNTPGAGRKSRVRDTGGGGSRWKSCCDLNRPSWH